MATNNALNVGLSGTTGSGNFVGNVGPTFITPALGTPSAGVLTNCTGLPVVGGGTGVASNTAYAVLCAGTTATGAIQSIASVGTAGQVLASNGAGALPTMQTISAVGGLRSFQILTSGSSATYTRPSGVTSILVEAIGGGGGGGGTASTSSQYGSAGGGAGGAYARKFYSSAEGTYTYTVGGGGAGGTAGNNNGTAGTATTFDTITASGGAGGTGSATATNIGCGSDCGDGVISTGGDINTAGGFGMTGSRFTTTGIGGSGGDSIFSGGAAPILVGSASSSVGTNATANTGGGGGGAGSVNDTTARAGGDGGSGIIIVWEMG